MTQVKPDVWRCLTHSGPEWEAAMALGAEPPCRLPSTVTGLELATDWRLDPGTALLLTEQADSAVWRRLAGNPNATPDVLRRLSAKACALPDSQTSKDALCRRLCSHPNTPPDALRRLLDSISARSIVAIAAQHPNLDKDVLRRLATEYQWDTDVLPSVAGNPNTPADVLDQLRDRMAPVRYQLAANPHTPPATLEYLVARNHHDVCQFAAANPNTPKALLEELSQSRWPSVRDVAAEQLRARREAAKSETGAVPASGHT